ncbi:isochorismatase family protein [Sphingomonas sp. XXL09]|uniref:isochorismatase family protein n=1 Tax=Sphingomonas sp. XXL09 TaxID=3457787 RepID=UPI00406BC0D2
MTRALIVIDVQEEYFPGGLMPLWQPEAVEARIVAGMARVRQAGDRVLLIRHVAIESGGPFAIGGAGVAIRSAILAAAGDAAIVPKSVPDAFQDTDLVSHLDGVDTLLLCGMMTQNCVVFTALSHAAAGYDVRVIGDWCTAPTEQVHRIALRALASKVEVIYGDSL